MRLAIDFNSVGRRGGGDETYCFGLARGLAQVETSHTFDFYTMASHPDLDAIARRPNFRIVRLRPGVGWLRIPVLLPLVVPYHLLVDRVDVFQSAVFPPPWPPCPMVFWLPDLSFKVWPQHYTLALRMRLLLLVQLGIRRATRILTISETSKSDIVAHYRVPVDKIDVTLLGVDHDTYNCEFLPQAVQGFRERYGLKGHFILYVGNIHPRKNLARLIRAYHSLRQTGRTSHRLVVVGRFRWQSSGVNSLIQQLGLQDEVRFTGHIPELDIPLAYHAADLLVYPSIYEGFGLPPLEAMACGTPVVASNGSVFREVLGDAAHLVDPMETDAIAASISQVLDDRSFREALVARGLERASRFQWRTTAEQTLKCYERAAEQA